MDAENTDILKTDGKSMNKEIQTEVCQVCMHSCRLSLGQWGFCRARKNENGRIVCKNYGQITSIALDPVEKKPLKMFYPGRKILSVGSYGCNMRCPFCQNHEISMAGGNERETIYLSPRQLADEAVKYKETGNIGIAFTYNEPLIGWEYIGDTAMLVKEAGMKNVLVTNGTASLFVLKELIPCIDAMNIDLKGFSEDYYKMLGGSLKTVKDFISAAAKDCHVELTTLIVPGENDSIEDMKKEAEWIASVNEEIPLHITRFFPQYNMRDKKATDVDKMLELAQTAEKYLKHVFLGNV